MVNKYMPEPKVWEEIDNVLEAEKYAAQADVMRRWGYELLRQADFLDDMAKIAFNNRKRRKANEVEDDGIK